MNGGIFNDGYFPAMMLPGMPRDDSPPAATSMSPRSRPANQGSLQSDTLRFSLAPSHDASGSSRSLMPSSPDLDQGDRSESPILIERTVHGKSATRDVRDSTWIVADVPQRGSQSPLLCFESPLRVSESPVPFIETPLRIENPGLRATAIPTLPHKIIPTQLQSFRAEPKQPSGEGALLHFLIAPVEHVDLINIVHIKNELGMSFSDLAKAFGVFSGHSISHTKQPQ